MEENPQVVVDQEVDPEAQDAAAAELEGESRNMRR